MKVYYGANNQYVDVTYICQKKLVQNGRLSIPKTDPERAKIFGDPLWGVLKNIKIEETIYGPNDEIDIPFDSLPLENFRKNWWNETGKFLDSPQEKLARLHEHICLNHGNMRDEYPEQLMAMTYILPEDTVLEIGGNIGRNSCIIASILDDDRRLVVLESCAEYAKQLEDNRNQNYFNFHIEASALSKVPLIQRNWNTFVSQVVPEGYTKVNTITFNELTEKYGLEFNVLVLDCEGAIYQILKDQPDLLDTIELIIIENDFTEIEKKEFVHTFFEKSGFQPVHTQAGGWGPCYSCFFQVWRKFE